jgi:hypothetical protein
MILARQQAQGYGTAFATLLPGLPSPPAPPPHLCSCGCRLDRHRVRCVTGEANVACNWGANPGAPQWQHNYYHKLLAALISSWRALFHVNFTAVVVQLAAYTNSVGNGSALPELRAAQQLGTLSQPHTGLAFPIDIGDDIRDVYPNPGGCHEFGGIHPRNKTEVGRRVA